MIILSELQLSVIKSGVRWIKALVTGKNDVRENIMECSPYGFDGCPIPGIRCVYADTMGQPATMLGYENKNQIATPGQSRMYSTDTSGVLKYFVYCKADKILIGTGTPTNHMTQYEGLATAFNQLKSDHDALGVLFNLHVHTGVTIGAASSGIPATSTAASTADITPAKLTNILTN